MTNKLRLITVFLFLFFSFFTVTGEVFAKAPVSPSNFRVQSNGNFNILNWDYVPGASGYFLYKAGCRIGQLSSGTKTYTDNMVGCGGGEIKYSITAYNSEGSSLPSIVAGKNRTNCGCDEIDFNRNHMLDLCKVGVISSACEANPQIGSDLYIFKSNYNKNTCYYYTTGDVNKDFKVDLVDFSLYSTWFNYYTSNNRFYCH